MARFEINGFITTLKFLLPLLAATFPCAGLAAPPVTGDATKGAAIVSQVCKACHGADGNGLTPPNPDFPKLAGKQPEYLLKQLKDFKSGKRNNDIMSGMVANLTPDDMANLALYFSAQKTTPGSVTDAGLLEFGKNSMPTEIPTRAYPPVPAVINRMAAAPTRIWRGNMPATPTSS